MKRTIGIIVTGLACVLGLLLLHKGLMLSQNDMRIYHEIGKHVFEDPPSFKSEYPPLISAIFALMSFGDQGTFTWLWILVFLGGASGVAVYGAWRLRDTIAVVFPFAVAFSVLLLGPHVMLARFDILMLIALFLAWRTHVSNRMGESGFWLAIAVALKLVPILLLPLFLVMAPRGRWKHLLIGFAAGGLVSAILAAVILGPVGLYDNTAYMLAYHMHRGVQAESLWSGLALLGGKIGGTQPGIVFDHGAYHLAGAPEWISHMATFAAIAGVGAITWLGRRRRDDKGSLGALCIALILWSLVTSPVLSPQYLVWAIPLLLLYCYERYLQKRVVVPGFPLLLGGTFLLALLTQWIYPTHYDDVIGMNDDALFILNIRNLLLPVVAGLLLWQGRGTVNATFSTVLHRRKAMTAAVFFIIALFGMPLAGMLVAPRWENVRYSFDGTTWEPATLPFRLAGKQSNLTIDMDVQAWSIRPRKYRIIPDDCLEEVIVNDKSLNIEKFCDAQNGRVVRIGTGLKSGVNSVRLVVRDTGGQTGVAVVLDPDDVLMQLFSLIWVLSFLISGWWLIVASVPRGNLRFILYAGLGGTLLRLLYMLSTQYMHRAYDWDGHIDYIRHVLTYWSIPPGASGWEMHQAPLYYFLTAGLYRAFTIIHTSAGQFFIGMLQFFSFLCSVGALALVLWMARRLFPRKPVQASVFCLVIASFPGLVMFASRISNDSLYHFLAFALLAAILLWWQKATRVNALLIAAVFAVTFLTKVSVVVLGPVIAACLFLHPRLAWKEKAVHACIMGLLVLGLAAWLPAVRFMEEQTESITSFGHSAINSGLLMPTRSDDFLTFNPVEVLRIPFNNTWDDASRRMYFWEFFFRSAFFGEFNMGEKRHLLSQLILLFGIGAAGLMLYGLWHELRTRWRETLPLWSTLGMLVSGSMVFRFLFHCSCDQDFRFAILAIVPMTYFAVSSFSYLPKRVVPVARHVLLLLAATGAALLLSFWLWP